MCLRAIKTKHYSQRVPIVGTVDYNIGSYWDLCFKQFRKPKTKDGKFDHRPRRAANGPATPLCSWVPPSSSQRRWIYSTYTAHRARDCRNGVARRRSGKQAHRVSHWPRRIDELEISVSPPRGSGTPSRGSVNRFPRCGRLCSSVVGTAQSWTWIGSVDGLDWISSRDMDPCPTPGEPRRFVSILRTRALGPVGTDSDLFEMSRSHHRSKPPSAVLRNWRSVLVAREWLSGTCRSYVPNAAAAASTAAVRVEFTRLVAAFNGRGVLVDNQMDTVRRAGDLSPAPRVRAAPARSLPPPYEDVN